MSAPLCVMLVAGEASGDELAAGLARALRRRLGGNVRFVGVGGRKLAQEGVESPFDIAEISIFGLIEGMLAWPKVSRLARLTAQVASREKPDLAVLVDSWGFTLRVARRLREIDPGLPLIKYVGPQVWASRPGRARTLAKAVDHLLAIHTFDAPYFEAHGLPTTFVGNNALALDFSGAEPDRFRSRISAAPGDQILVVLPGSRPSEIQRILPAFEAAVDILKAGRPGLHVVVPAAPTVAGLLKTAVAGWRHRSHVIEDEAGKLDAMKAATVALACSGTVTTELALAGVPMVAAYKTSPTTYAIAKRLIRTKYIVLLNVAAQEMVVPEMIQERCNGRDLAREVALRLDDEGLRRRQIDAQNAALDKMGRGAPDPSEQAAQAVLEVLEARRTA